jgi:hypothetical protein
MPSKVHGTWGEPNTVASYRVALKMSWRSHLHPSSNETNASLEWILAGHLQGHQGGLRLQQGPGSSRAGPAYGWCRYRCIGSHAIRPGQQAHALHPGNEGQGHVAAHILTGTEAGREARYKREHRCGPVGDDQVRSLLCVCDPCHCRTPFSPVPVA